MTLMCFPGYIYVLSFQMDGLIETLIHFPNMEVGVKGCSYVYSFIELLKYNNL